MTGTTISATGIHIAPAMATSVPKDIKVDASLRAAMRCHEVAAARMLRSLL